MKPLKINSSYDVTFSPDGSLLATNDARYVYIWDLMARKKVLRFRPFPWAGHPVFSPAGTRLALKSSSGRIGVVDVASGETVADFQNEADGEGCNLCWSADGRFLIDGSWNGRLMVRRWESGEPVFVREFPHESIHRIHSSRDGATWVVQRQPKMRPGMPADQPLPPGYFGVWIWPFDGSPERLLPVRYPRIDVSALSPDGTRIAVIHNTGYTEPAWSQNRITIMSLSDGSVLRSESLEEGFARRLAWSPDGRLLAATYTEKRVDPALQGFKLESMAIFWDPSDLHEVHRIAVAHPGNIAFSPAGALVAIAAHPGFVKAVDF